MKFVRKINNKRKRERSAGTLEELADYGLVIRIFVPLYCESEIHVRAISRLVPPFLFFFCNVRVSPLHIVYAECA